MPFLLAAAEADTIAKATADAAHASAPVYFQKLHNLLPAPFFHTPGFLAFFAIVLAVYWFIPRRWQMARVWVLVVASFHFYAAWSYELAFLVTGTTVADYLFGRVMGLSKRPGFRRLIVVASIVMNLGILCYFKYRGFFLNELYDGLRALGAQPGFEKLNPLAVFVPFGISFYTFEAISYAVDVYRRKIEPETSLPRFLLFILFFPHLVAGPIVRAGDFLTQARRPKRWNWVRVQAGVQLFLIGAFKKMAIADRMALFCDPVFKDPEHYSTSAVWLAVLAYAVRIYCDFSGYSDMAVGAAHLLGYKLVNNFNMPYLATNVSDFWRRWHVSLSTWLRDYVFIPLGGSRGSRWLNYRNLLVTMTVGGLWHGAAWGYILWGLAHGLMLVAHRQFRDYCEGKPRLTAFLETAFGTGLRIVLTFVCVSLCWVLFQPELSKALAIYAKLFQFQRGVGLPLNNSILWYLVGFLFACQWLVRSGVWAKVYPRLPAPVLGTGYAVCLCAALVLAPDNGTTFIYFQF
ncbi:MBOAT family O-acyltransferase [Frigoriglobus tundricola]|uniref:Putative poly(Beta-D-mannuronate) O-acetylase n=1 Tax=Frigoriglobus tundricola TaxID=2774151 RepID=A0A6M5YMK7_9BACT|nr:MBOAT family protein [Frigoriglobus tundricola]QJW95359.1 putative poly(beta-D-mannuronate) O-acetylase [Frigoriglobus tundricola]